MSGEQMKRGQGERQRVKEWEREEGKADGARKRLGWFNLFADPVVVPLRPLWQAEGIWQTDQNYNLIPLLTSHWQMACMWSLSWVPPANDAIEYAIIVDDLPKERTWIDLTLRPQCNFYYWRRLYRMKEATLKYSMYELVMYPEFKRICVSSHAWLEVPLMFNS